jgi:soluble lytic murein transglycosylase-like protein
MLFELGVCAQTASHTPTIDRFAKFIAEASVRFAVPAFWIRAVIQIESAGDAHSISPRGAMSLMQLMPGTWVELSVLYSLGLDPFDARDNILAGTAYLKRCTTVSARQAFLRPTMQVRGDMNSTS